jgi:hypothetical protein
MKNSLLVITLIIPLFLVIIFIVAPVFIKITDFSVGLKDSTNQSLVEMSETLKSTSPIIGIGLVIGLLVMFFSLASWFSGMFGSVSSKPLKSYSYEPVELEEDQEGYCSYCDTPFDEADFEKGKVLVLWSTVEKGW